MLRLSNVEKVAEAEVEVEVVEVVVAVAAEVVAVVAEVVVTAGETVVVEVEETVAVLQVVVVARALDPEARLSLSVELHSLFRRPVEVVEHLPTYLRDRCLLDDRLGEELETKFTGLGTVT